MAPQRKNKTTQEPRYRALNIYRFSLQQLWDLTIQKIKPLKTWDKPQLLVLNPYWISNFTFAQAFPLLRVWEQKQGFFPVIQTMYKMISGQRPYASNRLSVFKIMDVTFVMVKINKDYYLLGEQSPLAWSPWFPFQITWLIQHLWCILYTPRDLQLIWWWFGQPRTLVRPPTWTHTTNLEAWGPKELMNEHKVFPYLLECFINLSSQQQEEGHQFLQEILNLFLKNTDTGPGYTQLLREAVNPVYSIYYTPQGEEVRVTKDKKELRIFLQGYVGEAREPLETPEQIWERLKNPKPRV